MAESSHEAGQVGPYTSPLLHSPAFPRRASLKFVPNSRNLVLTSISPPNSGQLNIYTKTAKLFKACKNSTKMNFSPNFTLKVIELSIEKDPRRKTLGLLLTVFCYYRYFRAPRQPESVQAIPSPIAHLLFSLLKQ